MKKLKITQHPQVLSKFNSYPQDVHDKLNHLRSLIIETAIECVSIDELEETLKWGEPSYLTKQGSTIRVDWKAKSPDQYALYFKCTSKLVPTFRALYGDLFTYENNRAILFHIDDELPERQLKECMKMALTYHTIKNLPLLGKTSQPPKKNLH